MSLTLDELHLKDDRPLPELAPATKPSDDATSESDRAWLCARCAHRITSERERIEIGGSHAHTRLNPAGFFFHFGCFARADGCAIDGVPTTEHSWFAGCAWQYAYCASCRAHLGWFFSGADAFFALVLERIVLASNG